MLKYKKLSFAILMSLGLAACGGGGGGGGGGVDCSGLTACVSGSQSTTPGTYMTCFGKKWRVKAGYWWQNGPPGAGWEEIGTCN